MSVEVRLTSPVVSFDPRIENDVIRKWEIGPFEGPPSVNRRSPLNGYARTLTPEGGVHISYIDQDRSTLLRILRVVAWVAAIGTSGRLLFQIDALSPAASAAVFAAVMVVSFLLASRKIIVCHSVEIRPDCVIIDGEDVFFAEDFGDRWPEPHMIDDDPDRIEIGGIYGTRYVELMTANRLDKWDRTPEVLAADLEAALEQLWGRREVNFAPTEKHYV